MSARISINGLTKVYASGFKALDSVDLEIEKGEILSLLGPNGAGKTTLISIICGIANPSSGSVTVGGFDTIKQFRQARKLIGLVPQEVSLEPFEKVINTVKFSRGLFGLASDDAHIEKVLRQLSLWDKRDSLIMELSGGMKRRVLIAKALAHEPAVLFLDEPTAGVDVELRKDMWDTVRQLQKAGTTIILTTHYIEEAEAMADRIGVIRDGRILLVEDTDALMKRLGRKELEIELSSPIDAIPDALSRYALTRKDACTLVYGYDTTAERTGITQLLNDIQSAGLQLRDVRTRQSSLEDIFVDLVKENAA